MTETMPDIKDMRGEIKEFLTAKEPNRTNKKGGI